MMKVMKIKNNNIDNDNETIPTLAATTAKTSSTTTTNQQQQLQ